MPKNTKLSIVPTIKPPKEAFENKQLSLFQNFLANSDEEANQLSNTIELWDAIPKYHVSYRRQSALRQGGFLLTLEHNFVHRSKNYNVRIIPARIKIDGQDIEFYPGASEDIIEDILRKISCEQGVSFLDKNRSGVTFSVHMLKKELAARGHTRSYTEIHTSLLIMAGCRVELNNQESDGVYTSAILSSLLSVTRKRLEQDPYIRWYADFPSLVTEGIKSLSYRQFNYHVMMSHSTQLARWLHKRLSHNFTQASRIKSYGIKLSTIERDSGLLTDKRRAQRLKRVRDMLDELIDHKVLDRCSESEKRGARNSIVDVTFELHPHPDFCKEVVIANARAKTNLHRIK